jgi:hypothetical protein
VRSRERGRGREGYTHTIYIIVQICNETLELLATRYTMEAGVRELDRLGLGLGLGLWLGLGWSEATRWRRACASSTGMLCYVMLCYGAPSTARQLGRRQLGVAALCDICSVGGATHE